MWQSKWCQISFVTYIKNKRKLVAQQKVDLASFIKKAGREGYYDLDLDIGKGVILKCKLSIVPACPIRDSVLF